MSVHLVPDGLDGERVDVAASRMTGMSRSRIETLIADGHVQLDGRPAVKSDRVTGGSLLEVEDVGAPVVSITPREVIAKFKTIQMVDVCLPTTDGRELVLSRYTQPEPEHRLLMQRLQLRLPEQPPPKITAAQARQQAPAAAAV